MFLELPEFSEKLDTKLIRFLHKEGLEKQKLAWITQPDTATNKNALEIDCTE